MAPQLRMRDDIGWSTHEQIAKKVSGFLGVGNIQRIRLKGEELSK